MPTKNSRVRPVRIADDISDWIDLTAKKKGWSFNRWMNRAARQSLRKHRRKE
uniref:Uncharacterized protein n=1 Tax=viral metagenome TaxID=1070528 RepID=A0A6M3LDV3_9ZZZZ